MDGLNFFEQCSLNFLLRRLNVEDKTNKFPEISVCGGEIIQQSRPREFPRPLTAESGLWHAGSENGLEGSVRRQGNAYPKTQHGAGTLGNACIPQVGRQTQHLPSGFEYTLVER